MSKAEIKIHDMEIANNEKYIKKLEVTLMRFARDILPERDQAILEMKERIKGLDQALEIVTNGERKAWAFVARLEAESDQNREILTSLQDLLDIFMVRPITTDEEALLILNSMFEILKERNKPTK